MLPLQLRCALFELRFIGISGVCNSPMRAGTRLICAHHGSGERATDADEASEVADQMDVHHCLSGVCCWAWQRLALPVLELQARRWSFSNSLCHLLVRDGNPADAD